MGCLEIPAWMQLVHNAEAITEKAEMRVLNKKLIEIGLITLPSDQQSWNGKKLKLFYWMKRIPI